MIWEISYMVDPGDGIVSKETVQHATDEITEVIDGWRYYDDEEGNHLMKEYFIVGCVCLGDDSE